MENKRRLSEEVRLDVLIRVGGEVQSGHRAVGGRDAHRVDEREVVGRQRIVFFRLGRRDANRPVEHIAEDGELVRLRIVGGQPGLYHFVGLVHQYVEGVAGIGEVPQRSAVGEFRDEEVFGVQPFGQGDGAHVGTAPHLLQVEQLARIIQNEVSFVVFFPGVGVAGYTRGGKAEAFLHKRLRKLRALLPVYAVTVHHDELNASPGDAEHIVRHGQVHPLRHALQQRIQWDVGGVDFRRRYAEVEVSALHLARRDGHTHQTVGESLIRHQLPDVEQGQDAVGLLLRIIVARAVAPYHASRLVVAYGEKIAYHATV